MIRIRTKSTHITLRIGDDPKRRYESAIHALHVIRVAMVEGGGVIEDTTKTQQALAACIEQARTELDAAIRDVAPSQSQPRAMCVFREPEGGRRRASYYQTTDGRCLCVLVTDDNTSVWEAGGDDGRVRVFAERKSADDAIHALGYVIAPGDGSVCV